MQIRLKKEIRIYCELSDWYKLEPKLMPYILVDNKAYIQNLNLGLSVKDVLQQFMLGNMTFTEKYMNIKIPIGMWDFIEHLFEDVKVDDMRYNKKVDQIDFNFAYDYQNEAVLEMAKYTNGILKAPTGSGKTVMGIMLGLVKGDSFLWINDRIDLAKQAMKTAIERFNLDPNDCGLLQGDNEHIKKYTFTTIQKLHKVINQGFNNVENKLIDFDTIIIDECQHCIGSYNDYKQYFQVTRELNYNNLYGITATEDRVDGNEHLTFAVLGKVKHEVVDNSRKMLATVINKQCKINTPEVIYESFVNRYTGKAMPAKVEAYLLFHDEYLEFIKPYIIDGIKNYNKILIVSPRIAGANYISDYLKELDVEHFLVYGAIKKREKMYTSKVLVATLDLVKEGFDMPDLELVIVLARLPHKLIQTQIIGRAERYYKGKKDPLVYFLIPEMKRFERVVPSWTKLSLDDLLG